MRRIENVPYASRESGTLLLDLCLPDDDTSRRPGVIFIHGGAWHLGNKTTTSNDWLTEAGFVTASIDYRLSDVAPFPAQIHDVKAAVRWMRAHADEYGIDPDRIGVWGSSAGGHLSALCAVTNGSAWHDDPAGDLAVSSDVQCAVPLCAPTDLLIDWYAVGELPELEGAWDALVAFLGGPIPAQRDLAMLASPLWGDTTRAVPQLFVHGRLDDVVPVGQVRAHVAALLRDNRLATLVEISDQGHSVDAGIFLENPDPYRLRPTITAFFARHLMA